MSATCSEFRDCMYSIPTFWDGNPNGGPLAASDSDELCQATDSSAATTVFDSELGQEYKFTVGDRSGRSDGDFGLSVRASST